MNILVTGFTKVHCGEATRLRYDEATRAFTEALRCAGHAVDQRVVGVGEEIDGYDLVLVGVAPLESIAAVNAYGGLWALSQRGRIPVGTFLDDWRVRSVFAGFAAVTRRGEQAVLRHLYTNGRIHRRDADAAMEHRDALIGTALGFAKWWDAPLIGPFFRWPGVNPRGALGPYSGRVRRMATIDPSSLVPVPDIAPPSRRERGWVLAALSEQDANRKWAEKTGARWPVHQFGDVSKGATEAKVPEQRVLERYAESVGVMSPRHGGHDAFGWWRARFAHAAHLGNVMLADPREVGAAGWDQHLLAPSASRIERMGNDERSAYAAQQAAWLWEHAPSRDQAIHGLDQLVRQVVQMHRDER